MRCPSFVIVAAVVALLLGMTTASLVQYDGDTGMDVATAAQPSGGCTAKTLRSETGSGKKVDQRALEEVGQCNEESPAQDCEYCLLTDPDSKTCSSWMHSGSRVNREGDSWPLILSYVVGAFMAFGIGGNDAANSLATSVGSKAISLEKAVIMGAAGEFLGATFLGAGVSSTIQKGVASLDDPNCWACGYCTSQMGEYQLGMVYALCGASFFLVGITFFSLPVSTTHSVVGGVVGMTAGALGWGCLDYSFETGILRIVSGWVVSPLVSGLIGVIMYVVTYYCIFRARSPKSAALMSVPILYGVTFGVMMFLTMEKASMAKAFFKGFEEGRALTIKLIIVAVTTVTSAAAAYIVATPSIRDAMDDMEKDLDDTHLKNQPWKATKRMSQEGPLSFQKVLSKPVDQSKEDKGQIEMIQNGKGTELESNGVEDVITSDGTGMQLLAKTLPTKEQWIAKKAFQNLLVMTAFMETFAHGANDTANATGPVGAVQFAYSHGIHACGRLETPWYIMSGAGIFVGLGVIFMGYRVIKAVGEEIADIDFHIGFCVEFASASAVVLATYQELPVSTTHCQIGAIVFVSAIAYGPSGVSWGMFGKIAVSWLATLPAAGGLAWVLTKITFG